MNHSNSPGRHLSLFGQQLRAWRHRRGLSQLELALAAGSTPRHVSFVETGRSRPGQDLIMRFASALDIPLEDRNRMLLAAGLAPEFSRHALEDDSMAPVRRVIRSILDKHEPYPGWCMTRSFQFQGCNRAAERLFPGLTRHHGLAFVDNWFGPGPFRSLVENWQDCVHAGIALLWREVLQTADPEIQGLLDRALEHVGGISPAPAAADMPVICPILNINGERIRTIGTVMRFDSATDVTAANLKLELMFPADEVGVRFFQGMAEQRPVEAMPTAALSD